MFVNGILDFEMKGVEDDERGGHPKSTRTEVNIAAVANLVKNDSQITSRMKEECLTFPRL